MDLDIGNYDSQYEFYLSYKTQNNITSDEYDKLHVFGVPYSKYNSNENVGGWTFSYYYPKNLSERYNNPACTFVLAGYLDSLLKIYPYNFNEDTRKKYIMCATAHEVAHCRGLTDWSAPPDHVHGYHTPGDGFCDMFPFNLSYGNEMPNRYPPYLCSNHLQIMKDSLKNYIKYGLYWPPSY